MDTLNKLKTIKPNQEWKRLTRSLLAPYEVTSLGLPVFGITILGTALFIFVIVNTAVSSIPGEKLYTFKKGLERAQIGFSLNKSNRAKLELEFVGRRADELTQLGQVGQRRDVSKETISVFRSARDKINEVAQTVKTLPPSEKIEASKLLQNKVEAVSKAVSDLPNNLKSDIVSTFGQALDPTILEDINKEKPKQDIDQPEVKRKESIFQAPLDIKNPHSNSRYQQ